MREFRSQERKGVMSLGVQPKERLPLHTAQNSHLQPARQRSAIPKPWTAAPPGGSLSS